MNFIQLHNNFNNVVNNFDNIVIKVISQHKEIIIDLNTIQLEKGIASDGLGIEPKYAYDEYARFKKSIGSKSPLGTPDLKLTGDFYSGFHTKILPSYIEIESKDEKASDLENKYSSLIYGLTEKSKYELIEFIKETLKETIQNELTK